MKIPRKTAQSAKLPPAIKKITDIEKAISILQSDCPHNPAVVDTLTQRLGGGPVLSVADGKEWDDTHGAAARFFVPKFVLKNYVPGINTIAEKTFAAIAKRASSHPDGEIT